MTGYISYTIPKMTKCVRQNCKKCEKNWSHPEIRIVVSSGCRKNKNLSFRTVLKANTVINHLSKWEGNLSVLIFMNSRVWSVQLGNWERNFSFGDGCSIWEGIWKGIIFECLFWFPRLLNVSAFVIIQNFVFFIWTITWSIPFTTPDWKTRHVVIIIRWDVLGLAN